MKNAMTENAIGFLDNLRRPDLVALLSRAELNPTVCGRGYSSVDIHAPEPFAEALTSLPITDQKRITEAAFVWQQGTVHNDKIVVYPAGDLLKGPETILPELIIHREMMIGVATGEMVINDVDDYYKARQARLTELCTEYGIPYENPHAGLWDWFRHWKEHFASYAERRAYVKELFARPVAIAASRINNPGPIAEREPTGWERVDRCLARARLRFEGATVEEDWQAVGLLCREVMISLAQAVYDPAIHASPDGVKISKTDANRMIEAYVAQAFPGSSFQEVRLHARASMGLALNLQHRRTATRQLAALCLEATSSAVAVITIIAKPD